MKTRAVAMAIFVKSKIQSSAIPKWSYNKIRQITGLHIQTIRNYCHILRDLGLIAFIGKGQRTLIFKSLASRHENRNISLKAVVLDSVKSVAYSLFSLVIVHIQQQKDFVKQTIDRLNNPRNINEYKEARRTARSCGWREAQAVGCNDDYKDSHRSPLRFIENGLSLLRISKKIKSGLQRAQHVVNFATAHKFINKHKHSIFQFCQQAIIAFKFSREGWTFATDNYLYKIFANSYSIGERCLGLL